MNFDLPMVTSLLKQHYNLNAVIEQLPGELDLNFFVKSAAGACYIFKIANANEILVNLELQNAVINHLTTSGIGLMVSSVVPSIDGREIIQLESNGSSRLARLLTWVDGRPFAKVNPLEVAANEPDDPRAMPRRLR